MISLGTTMMSLELSVELLVACEPSKKCYRGVASTLLTWWGRNRFFKEKSWEKKINLPASESTSDCRKVGLHQRQIYRWDGGAQLPYTWRFWDSTFYDFRKIILLFVFFYLLFNLFTFLLCLFAFLLYLFTFCCIFLPFVVSFYYLFASFYYLFVTFYLFVVSFYLFVVSFCLFLNLFTICIFTFVNGCTAEFIKLAVSALHLHIHTRPYQFCVTYPRGLKQ